MTGNAYESWHYRYVGAEAAKAMHESGQTLEEYAKLLDGPLPQYQSMPTRW
ncbi:hypothetical protein [Bifidobacterium bifidum]|uniref:hypothetical protein n=1 Tax=Bifidobacterium bifidum TaxID=1681 RepID=UPI00216AD380|nr:hypothetical protein [Bifidobacterium bifidum]